MPGPCSLTLLATKTAMPCNSEGIERVDVVVTIAWSPTPSRAHVAVAVPGVAPRNQIALASSNLGAQITFIVIFTRASPSHLRHPRPSQARRSLALATMARQHGNMTGPERHEGKGRATGWQAGELKDWSSSESSNRFVNS